MPGGRPLKLNYLLITPLRCQVNFFSANIDNKSNGSEHIEFICNIMVTVKKQGSLSSNLRLGSCISHCANILGKCRHLNILPAIGNY